MEPTCPNPECNAPMVWRIAGRGPNAGNGFWGCSTYPKCKGTRSAEMAGKDPQNETLPTNALPRRVQWFERTAPSGWDLRYIPGGGSLRSSNRVRDCAVTAGRGAIGRLEQAFLAITPPEVPVSDLTVEQVVGTFRKILQRGDLPPIDPTVEATLLKQVGVHTSTNSVSPDDLTIAIHDRDLPSASVIENALASADRAFEPRTDWDFDSEEEEQFFNWACDELGANARWLYPQVNMGLLGAIEGDARRVDFLFAPPWGKPVVVEIDGAQHQAESQVDSARDTQLNENGIEVLRLSANEVRTRSSDIFGRLVSSHPEQADDTNKLLVFGPAFANRLGLALAEGVERGWLPGADTWHIAIEDELGIARLALKSLLELFGAIDELWGGLLAPSECIVDIGEHSVAYRRIGVATYESRIYNESTRVQLRILLQPGKSPQDALPQFTAPTIVVRGATVPAKLADRRADGSQLAIAKDVSAITPALERILQFIFAKRSFREGQLEALIQVLKRKDCLVLLPTGAGKSLIYQLAGLVLPGRTLVIDPLIALIEDQVASLKRYGIDRVSSISSYTTQQGLTELAMEQVQSGDSLFFFVAPERLQTRPFREALSSLTVQVPINLVVADEAHCISEWGHDFRPAYLNLGPLIRRLCRSSTGESPPILGLTGTASRSVLRDVLIELDLDQSDPEALVKPKSFDRPELSYEIMVCRPNEARGRLIGMLKAMPNRLGLQPHEVLGGGGAKRHLGIVFCPHVNGELGVVKVASDIRSQVTPSVAFYAGGAPKGQDPKNWENRKRDVAEQFRNGDISILCATKAFGMGIDIPNVRYTLHSGIPGSIEAFYQEAGRAGRDRRRSRCALVFSEIDARLTEQLLSDSTDGEQARESFSERERGSRDDVLNQLWFHFKTFKGQSVEAEAVRSLLARLSWTGTAKSELIPFERLEDNRAMQERSILRLLQVGMVEDYLVDRGRHAFEVHLREADRSDLEESFLQYVRRTQPGLFEEEQSEIRRATFNGLSAFAEFLAGRVLDLLYGTIERSRRRSLREMRLLAAETRTDADIRARLEDYFREGELAPILQKMAEATGVRHLDFLGLYRKITIADVGELRGASARLLESYPDHPGLLLGRGYAELVDDANHREFRDDLERVITAGVERYQMTASAIADVIAFLLEEAGRFNAEWRTDVWAVIDKLGRTANTNEIHDLERRTIRQGNCAPGEDIILMARSLERNSQVAQRLAIQHELAEELHNG